MSSLLSQRHSLAQYLPRSFLSLECHSVLLLPSKRVSACLCAHAPYPENFGPGHELSELPLKLLKADLIVLALQYQVFRVCVKASSAIPVAIWPQLVACGYVGLFLKP